MPPVDSHWRDIGLGLLIGLASRYGLVLQSGRKISLRIVGIDLLFIGMNALIASWATTRWELHGEPAIILSAVIFMSAQRTSKLLRDEYERRFGKAFGTTVFAAPDTKTSVPSAAPDVEVVSVGRRTPQSTRAVALKVFREIGEAAPAAGERGDFVDRLLGELDDKTRTEHEPE